MKSVVTFALALTFSAAASAAVPAGSTTVNVAKCSDKKGRVLLLDQSTGLTDGKGIVLAVVLIGGKAIGFPQPMKKAVNPETGARSYTGGGITAVINGVETMDLPAGQIRGSLQLQEDAKPVPMLCNKGPAFLSK